MAIPWIDLSNVKKWLAGSGSGTTGDPYIPAVAIDVSGGAVSVTGSTALTAGEAHLGELGGNMIAVAVEFTRPSDTNAYGLNDVVSDSTSATTMQAIANAGRVSGGSGYIVGIRISTDKKSITPQLRIHFFNTNGATVSADNANWQDKYADAGKRIGYYDMPAMTTAADTSNSDMSRTVDMTMRIPYVCAATSLYFVLETLTVFTPANGQKFTVTIFADRN